MSDLESPPSSPALSPAPSLSPEEDVTPFRLLDLPPELVLEVVAHVSLLRPLVDIFPSGPPSELLALSETNRLFATICRDSIWAQINYKPVDRDYLVRPAEYKRKRSLCTLLEILVEAEASGNGLLPIGMISAAHVGKIPRPHAGQHLINNEKNEFEEENEGFLQVLAKLLKGGGLRVVFLRDISLDGEAGERLVRNFAEAKGLRALRFNQVSLRGVKKAFFETLQPMPNLKSLQVMHGESSLVEFVRLTPNVESLLLWPQSRYFGSLGPVIASLLGSLRFLSLDAVSEPTCFKEIASELVRRSKSPSETPSPLTELFLEGHQTSSDRSALLAALATVPLKRLALYHLRTVKPALIHEIAHTLPKLEGLTLVQGDTSGPVQWRAAPLEEFVEHLAKLKHLRTFAWDRKSPMPLPGLDAKGQRTSRAAIEFDALAKVGVGCPSLESAVAICLDVSQGARGFFATFRRDDRKIQMKMQERTVQDFLISFQRWCRY